MAGSNDKDPRGRKGRVTLRDLSRASGLAVSTISNALAGKDLVREDTRRHIQAIAEELGYRAFPLARSLRTGKTHSIGLLVADIANSYYAEVVRGAEEVFMKNGHFLLIGNTDHRAEVEYDYVGHFLDRQVDAILLFIHGMNSKSVRRIQDSGVPLVLINRRHQRLTNDLVGVDFHEGTRIALECLWNLGHRAIGFITGRPDSAVTDDRIAATQSFLSEKGAPPETVVFEHAGYSIEAGREATRRLLGEHPNLTAIMTAQDQSAVGCLGALDALGLRVPDDISVVGFDDIPMAGLPRIDLTTIRVACRGLGQAAARLALERIATQEGSTKTILISPELIVRGTTAPPRRQSELAVGRKNGAKR